MYFKFPCEKCSKNLKVRDEDTGRKARCPYCKHTMVVPAPPSPADSFAAALQGLTGDAADTGPALTRPGSTPKAAPSSTAAAAAPQAAQAPGADEGHHQWVDGSNVSMITSGLFAIGGSVVWVIVLLPFKSIYIGELFLDRGWVPYALIFLMSWSLAILYLKSRKLRRQKESMLFDLLPTELSEEITIGSLDKFTNNIRSLPSEPGESFLITRVLRGLEHFRVRKSTPEVANLIASQSDIDANTVDSSYTLIKVFIWAIPILGFIGTVIGISSAVGGFSGTLDSASDVSALKTSLNNVTGGLATAFDTTLIALVMSIMVMFPSSSMQKSEEDLLNWVDEYCNENLLKRLNDGDRDIDSTGDMKEDIRRAIRHALAGKQGEMLTQIEASRAQLAEIQKEQVEQLNKVMSDLMDRTGNVQNDVSNRMRDAAQSLERYFGAIERGVSALNGTLEKLGQQQVVVQTPRRRLFGLLGPKNGDT